MNSNNEQLQTLLILLNKSEQILSILNLPDNIINKYNQLKELTYEKLNFEFTPLIKANKKSFETTKISTNQQGDPNRLRILNIKKNAIIEYMFDLIDKFKFEKNQYMSHYLLENYEFSLHEKLNKINFNSASFDELEFEMKLEEIKLRDYLGKIEIYQKKFISGLKLQSIEHPTRFKQTIYSQEKEDDKEKKQIEEIILDYERKIENIKISHENELKEFRGKFEDLKSRFKPELESQFNYLQETLRDKDYLLDKINEILNDLYQKYYQNNLNWKENVEFKFKEIEKLSFLSNIVGKFFSDNKYLIELVSDLQKEKNILLEERNLPYVLNSINKNNVLVEISQDIKNYETEFKRNNEQFNEIINYINNNFSNLID